jgi:signal transduction histidine kinase
MAIIKHYRWAWFICLILLIGFLTNSISSYLVSRSNVRKTIIESSLPLTSDNVYSEIQRDLLKPIFISSLMANDTFLRDWVIDNENDPSQIAKYLSEIKNQYSTVSSFFVSEKTRTYYHANGILKKISEHEARDGWYFRIRNMPEPYEINVDIDMANRDEMTIFINYRVFDYDGRFIGATGVGLTVNRVNELIQHYESKFNRLIYFVDETGKIVLRSHSSPISQYASIQEIPGLNREAIALMSKKTSQTKYELNDETRFLNCRLVPELKWFLVVEQTEETMLAPLKEHLIENIILALFVTVVIALICVTAINREHSVLERKNDSLRARNDQIERQKAEIATYAGKLEQANEQLSYLNKEKDEFIGIAAHDLKNPLTGILSMCELVRDTDNNHTLDTEAFIAHIQESATGMIELISNLLDVSYIESFEGTVELKTFDLSQLLKKLSKLHRTIAHNKYITIETDSQFEACLEVTSHESWMEICLNNLISNAIKYTPPHGKVHITCEKLNDAIAVNITDTGPGIANDELPRLFKKFERLSARPTAGESSTGLGLYVVNKMCTRMGAKIEVRTRLGEGSTFSIKIPHPKTC